MARTQVELTEAEEFAETWRDVVGYEGHYEVSSFGRVKSLKNYHGFKPGRILKQKINPKNGYLQIALSRNSKLKTFYVHDLVALAFIGPRPPGHEINHKRPDVGEEGAANAAAYKRNNRADNLEYVTKKKNMEHAAAMGLTSKGKPKPGAGAKGDRNGSRTHPERQIRGARHHASTISDATREAILAEYDSTVNYKGFQSHLMLKYGASRRAIQRTLEKRFKLVKPTTCD